MNTAYPGFNILEIPVLKRLLVPEIPQVDVINERFLRKHFVTPKGRRRLVLDWRFAAYREKYPHARLDLMRSDLSKSIFIGTSLHGAACWKTNFSGSIFTDTSLKEVSLAYASMNNCSFARVTMRGADLTRTNFEGSRFDKVKVTGANMHKTDFTKTELIETNLIGEDISFANFWKAKMPPEQQRYVLAQLQASLRT